MTTLVFDVGNVLLRWDARLVLADVLPEAEIDPCLEEIGFAAWNLEQDRGRSWDEGVALASAAHPRHAGLIERFHTHWHLSVPGTIAGTVEILRRAHGAGQPVYAITNFSAEKWAECQARFDFLTLFADAVVSGQERLLKPDPTIYRVLLDRNGLDAKDYLFIDDSPRNVDAARALGMQAVQFTDADALAQELDRRGLLP
ncbi:MAG: HAD family phosphatase [Pseudomonadota bacterium]